MTTTRHIIAHGRGDTGTPLTYYHTGGIAIYISGPGSIDVAAYLPIGYTWSEPGAVEAARDEIRHNGWPVD